MNRSILNAVFGEADKALFKSIAKRLGMLEKNISENSGLTTEQLGIDPVAGSTTKYLSEKGTMEEVPDAPALLTNITYAQLAAAISGSTLVPGAKYLITDYQTVHTIPNTEDTNTGTVEPLMVTAISVNELAPEAYSALFPDDIIYYSPTNDQVVVPGCTKGYIYRRVDTKQNNDIPFDFRQVKFRRWQISQPTWDEATTYTKGKVVKSTSDATLWVSLVGENLNNEISNTACWRRFEWDNLSYVSPFENEWAITNGAVTITLSCTNNFNDYKMWSDDVFYDTAYLNKLRRPSEALIESTNSVIYGIEFLCNNIGEDFTNNSIGASVYYNNIGVGFNGNSISDNFNNNSIRDGFSNNSIGAFFINNNIGITFSNNSIGNGFGDNSIDGLFVGNSINTGFAYNNICTQFSGNAIGANLRNMKALPYVHNADLISVTELYDKSYPHEIMAAVSGVVIRWYDGVGAQQTQFIA